MSKSIIYTILSIVILAGGFIGYRYINGNDEALYEFATVQKESVRQMVSVDGFVTPAEQVNLSFEISGKVKSVGVVVGEQVIKNQIIAELNDDIFRAQLKKSQASLTVQQEDLGLMRRKWDKVKPEEREAQKAKVEEAYADVWEAEERLKKTVLHSPIDGIIAQRNTEKGETVSANEIIVNIIQEGNNNETEVEANVPEVDVAKVAIGNKVEIKLDAFEDKIFSGKITSLEPAETNIQGAIYYKIKVVFDENLTNVNIMSGMTADLNILTARKDDVLALPIGAVKQKEGRKYVQILENGENGKLIDLEIEIGLEGIDNIEISKGLEQGDQVVSFINKEK